MGTVRCIWSVIRIACPIRFGTALATRFQETRVIGHTKRFAGCVEILKLSSCWTLVSCCLLWEFVHWFAANFSMNLILLKDDRTGQNKHELLQYSVRTINNSKVSGLTPISRRLIYCGDVVLGFRLHPLGETARCSNRWFFVNYTNLLFFDIFWPRTCILTLLRYFRNCKGVLFMSCHLWARPANPDTATPGSMAIKTCEKTCKEFAS